MRLFNTPIEIFSKGRAILADIFDTLRIIEGKRSRCADEGLGRFTTLPSY